MGQNSVWNVSQMYFEGIWRSFGVCHILLFDLLGQVIIIKQFTGWGCCAFLSRLGSVSHQRLPALSSVPTEIRGTWPVSESGLPTAPIGLWLRCRCWPEGRTCPSKLWKCKKYDQPAQSLGDVCDEGQHCGLPWGCKSPGSVPNPDHDLS